MIYLFNNSNDIIKTTPTRMSAIAEGLDNIIDEKIILLSSDNKEIEISRQNINESTLLKTMANDEKATKFPVKVEYRELKMVVEYLNHYSEKMPQYPSKITDFKSDISEWDFKFIDIDLEILIKLTNTVSYLDINPLLNLCCMKFASLIKGKSLQEIESNLS